MVGALSPGKRGFGVKVEPPNTERPNWLLLIFGVFCLLLPVPFIWLHIVTPSDGARLAREPMIYTEQGVVVSVYAPGLSALQDGDIVIAVDGIPIGAWVNGLIRAGPERPHWQVGQTVTYTVLRSGKAEQITLTLGRLPWRAILGEHWSVILFFLISQVIAGFVYLQRRADPAAQALFIWAFSGSHTYTWAFFLQISDLINPLGFWLFHLAATGLWLTFWAAVVHMALVFPKPIVHDQRLRQWIILFYLSPFAAFGIYLLWQWSETNSLLIWWDRWGTGQSLIAALYTLPALVLITVQYITSHSGIERIKTRWVIFGTLFSLSLGLMLYFIPALTGSAPISANGLGIINFPFIISLAIAIWRYHLFDIDLIIRRTLQYTLLTSLLTLIYFSGVALLQAALRIVGGQSSSAVIVITTLGIAALFNPLRRRIQDFIDRRFYRQRYDAEKALASFAEAARGETDLAQLSGQLTAIVQETLQPSQVSLWLITPRRAT